MVTARSHAGFGLNGMDLGFDPMRVLEGLGTLVRLVPLVLLFAFRSHAGFGGVRNYSSRILRGCFDPMRGFRGVRNVAPSTRFDPMRVLEGVRNIGSESVKTL